MSTHTNNNIPKTGLPGLVENWKSDMISGFLVFLIALPLCLGISMASGFPAVAGIFSAIIGGIVVSFFGGSNLTIKGPAAGLIAIALASVEELGNGDALTGYKMTLAVIVVAGLIQIVLGLLKSGVLSDFFPSAAVHGMLAAIGIIIIAKQAHTLLGVRPHAKETLELIMEIPQSISKLRPEIAIIGAVSLAILFLYPLIKNKYLKLVPPPVVVIIIAVILGYYFDLDNYKYYTFLDTIQYNIGSKFLVNLPDNLLDAVTFPDFSAVFSGASIKYIIMFALVGSLESLLSSKAIDSLDPMHRKSKMNRDLIGIGVGNSLAGMIGGLPMISEIVRSSANINYGGKTWWSNVFHGLFILIFVAFFPSLIHHIPLTTLAAMLIYTGFRLASPMEFVKTYKIGKEQLFIFITTIIVTLATDLLLGIFAGIMVKLIIHSINGLSVKRIFKPNYTVTNKNNELTIQIFDSAVFSNYINLKKSLDVLPSGKTVIVDFSQSNLIDHTVMENLFHYKEDYEKDGGIFTFVGLENHVCLSNHSMSARKKNKPKTLESA